MVLRIEYTPGEYEAEVAEILRSRFGASATIETDVHLPGAGSGRTRQIDVLARLHHEGMEDTLMVVDCKLYARKVDVKAVEAFIGLVKDVGAPLGLLVTNKGFTRAAEARAKYERGIRVEVIDVTDLPTWEPNLAVCELCRDAVHPESMPGVVYVDSPTDIQLEDGDIVEVLLGYCDKCAGLSFECPFCGLLTPVWDFRDEWIECDGACGAEFSVRPMTYKDDLINPTHDRLVIKPPPKP